MIDCITNLIGLSNQTCSCLEASKPVDFDAINETATGLYIIQDSDYGSPLLNAILESGECGDENVWEKLQEVRNDAITWFDHDISIELRKMYDKTTEGISKELGQRKKGVPAFAPGRDKAGVQIEAWQNKDRIAYVNNIYVGFTDTRTFDLTVSSNNPDFTTITRTLNSTANTWHKNALTTPIELPLWTKANIYSTNSKTNLLYNFYYDTAGITAFRNETVMGCCSRRTNKYKWGKDYNEYFILHGLAGDTINDTSVSTGVIANGLVLDVSVACSDLQWICDLDIVGGADIKKWVAVLLRHKAIQMLALHILNSGQSNYWTTIGEKKLWKIYQFASEEYTKYLSSLAKHLPRNASGCYKCKPLLMTVPL